MKIVNAFYLAIMNRLIAKVPEINYFDWWNNQLNNEEEDLPFNFPAIFMEYDPINWQTLGRKRQAAIVTFRLYIAIDNLMEKSSNEKEKIREGALKDTDIISCIFKALQGYNGGGCFGSITRNNEIPDHNSDAIQVPVLEFRTRLVDNYAQPETIKLTNVKFKFTGEFYKKTI